jgi:hypothetical protein
MEGWAAEQINSVVLIFRNKIVKVVQDLWLDLGLQLKYKKICYAMYLGRHKFYLRVGYDGW